MDKGTHNNIGLLFDSIERQIIIDFYKRCKTKSKFWKWWHSNIIIDRYESLKALKDAEKEIKSFFRLF